MPELAADMTPCERVRRAMVTGVDPRAPLPDRVPVFCQLAVGHYFLQSGLKPFDIWFRSEAFAEALVSLARRYRFDGILCNLPGREPDFERELARIEAGDREDRVVWRNGNYTILPHDDNPHYFQADGTRYFPAFEEIDPTELFYVEPWDLTDITYPFSWGFEREARSHDDFFPDFHLDTLKTLVARAGDELSIHSEVFSPFSQFLELLNYEAALMGLLDDPGKSHACLEALSRGAIELGRRQAACGVDAVLISSAFAGAGLISREHYGEFVLPYEQRVVEGIRRSFPRTFVYTHTCGSIGDRLDLMLETGTLGIDTLDPPPLGTVELTEAKENLAGKAFIKGNLDPVNTLLRGGLDDVRREAIERLETGAKGGGYILSSACSVAPAAPPENLEILAEIVAERGRYDG